MEEIQPEQQSKSTRSYEDWKMSLISIYTHRIGLDERIKNIKDEQIKPFYNQGLMPTVAFNELFNK